MAMEGVVRAWVGHACRPGWSGAREGGKPGDTDETVKFA